MHVSSFGAGAMPRALGPPAFGPPIPGAALAPVGLPPATLGGDLLHAGGYGTVSTRKGRALEGAVLEEGGGYAAGNFSGMYAGNGQFGWGEYEGKRRREEKGAIMGMEGFAGDGFEQQTQGGFGGGIFAGGEGVNVNVNGLIGVGVVPVRNGNAELRAGNTKY